MSQLTATARPLPRSATRRPAPSLTVVQGERGLPGAWFMTACLVTLVGGLLTILILNTSMAQGAFTLHALQERSSELSDRQEALTESIDEQRAPARLAVRAQRLGMVPVTSTGYVSLDKGSVTGVAQPASAAARLTVVTAPDQKAWKAAQAAAKAAAEKARWDRYRSDVAKGLVAKGVAPAEAKRQAEAQTVLAQAREKAKAAAAAKAKAEAAAKARAAAG
ncbi:MAG: hypothetical protein LWW86_06130 [Micrococcales bacterium]|nr:hypothetical protein [Micrococcales bacterium]